MRRLTLCIGIFGLMAAFGATAFGQASLRSLGGGNIDVTAQKGKVVVLVVGASWLPLSETQAEVTNTLVKKYAAKPVVFYFVATDAATAKNAVSDAELKQFAAKNKITVPMLRDPDGAVVMSKLNVEQVPSFVILDKNGSVSGEPFGGLDPKSDAAIPLSKMIDKLL
ncbi:MAG TPA: TlpA disulfide reductase family protein [Pyrinomonadaceae bacterium]|nr:TlpA disulfide reductase family protein [Pyrinomonadaceae bacterium]